MLQSLENIVPIPSLKFKKMRENSTSKIFPSNNSGVILLSKSRWWIGAPSVPSLCAGKIATQRRVKPRWYIQNDVSQSPPGGGQRRLGQKQAPRLYANTQCMVQDWFTSLAQRVSRPLQEIKDRARISECLAVFSVHTNKVAYEERRAKSSLVLNHSSGGNVCVYLYFFGFIFDLQTSREITSVLEHNVSWTIECIHGVQKYRSLA